MKKEKQWVKTARIGGVSIISLASVIRAPAGIGSATFILVFSLTRGIIKKKKMLNITRNKKWNLIKLLCLLRANLIALKL